MYFRYWYLEGFQEAAESKVRMLLHNSVEHSTERNLQIDSALD